VKFDVLGVPEGPVVSEAAVGAMAVGAAHVLHADVTIAVTGVAGPDPQDGNSATVATDATGAQISPDDVKRIEDGLKNF
jgi:nicotinamide mononucleotide (NMN) deamidase PncC